MQQRTCRVADCDWPSAIKGRCAAHHAQWKRGLPEGPIRRRVNKDRLCATDECERKAPHGRHCKMHAQRIYTRGSAGRAAMERPGGSRFRATNGYVRIHMPRHPQANVDGYIQEHRVVMEATLGRPLKPFENVHHKNGLRYDNRPENLELWTKPQPTGQRPEDLVAWVVQYYPDLVRAALEAGTQCP